MKVIGAGGQVAGDAEVGQPEVRHLDVAEMLLQPLAHLLPPGHGHHRKGGVPQRAGFHEGLADAPFEFLVIPSHGDARGDDRAHGRAANQVDGDVGFVQGADHADVGVGARAAAGQHQAHGLAHQQSGEPAQVAAGVLPDMQQPVGRRRLQPGLRARGQGDGV